MHITTQWMHHFIHILNRHFSRKNLKIVFYKEKKASLNLTGSRKTKTPAHLLLHTVSHQPIFIYTAL